MSENQPNSPEGQPPTPERVSSLPFSGVVGDTTNDVRGDIFDVLDQTTDVNITQVNTSGRNINSPTGAPNTPAPNPTPDPQRSPQNNPPPSPTPNPAPQPAPTPGNQNEDQSKRAWYNPKRWPGDLWKNRVEASKHAASAAVGGLVGSLSGLGWYSAALPVVGSFSIPVLPILAAAAGVVAYRVYEYKSKDSSKD